METHEDIGGWPAVRALDGEWWADNRIAIDEICRMRLRRDTIPDIEASVTFEHWCWMLLGWPDKEAWRGGGG
jgi:hypothetical protein